MIHLSAKMKYLLFVELTVLSFLLISCGPAKQMDGLRSAGSKDARAGDQIFSTYNGLGIDSQKITIVPNSDITGLQIALSACHCGPNISRLMFEHESTARRTLPQALTPKIREEIRKNPMLAALDGLPSILGNILTSLAASDDKMAVQIRDGVLKTLQPTLTAVGSGKFLPAAPFRFDLFGTSSELDISPSAAQKTSFTASTVATYWSLVFGADELWSAVASPTNPDVGAQTLEVVRTMAEWAYLLGIGGDGKPNGFGGIAFDIKIGPEQYAVPVPAENIAADEGRFVSGKYSITYPNIPTIKLATKIQEVWKTSSNGMPLLEQATVWRSAALAFGKLRSDNSGNFRTLFTGDNPPLSQTSPGLPLVWLPAMGHYLKNFYINQDTHKIYAYGAPSEQIEQEEASLEALTMLGFALHDWIIATRNISKTDLRPEVIEKISGLDSQLKDPLRLTILTILNRFTKKIIINDLPWLAFTDEKLEDTKINAAIALILSTEQNVLKGDLLKARGSALFHWYVAKKLMAPENGQFPVSPASTAWLLHNSRLMEKYENSPTWIHALTSNLDTALGGFNP